MANFFWYRKPTSLGVFLCGLLYVQLHANLQVLPNDQAVDWGRVHQQTSQVVCQVDSIVNPYHIDERFKQADKPILTRPRASYRSKASATTDEDHLNLKPLKFRCLIMQIGDNTLKRPVLSQLYWRHPNLRISHRDILKFSVKLKPAHSLANQGGLIWQSQLLQKQIRLTGYVKEHSAKTLDQNQVLNKGQAQRLEKGLSWRQKSYNWLNDLLPQSQAKPIYLALVTGQRQSFTTTHWQTLQRTGTTHLVAISGLHLALIVSGAYLLARTLFRFMPIALLRVIPAGYKVYLPWIFAWFAACSYSAMSGFATPTLRALVMFSIFMIVHLSGIKLTSTRWLLLAIAVIVLVHPFAFIDLSFWLSLSAVVTIIFSLYLGRRFIFASHQSHKDDQSNQSRIANWLKGFLVVQVALSFVLLPLSGMLFGEFSLVAPLANFVLVPLFSFAVMPLVLGSACLSFVWLRGGQVLADIAITLLEYCWHFLEWLAAFEHASISLNYLAINFLIVLLTVFVFSVFFKRLTRVLVASLAGFTVFTLLYLSAIKRDFPVWQMTVLDVGHGTSVVIERNNKALVYDTGASFPSGDSIAARVLMPYLRSRGIDEIDTLVISHFDNDHSGGLTHLLERGVVLKLISNEVVPTQNDKVSMEQGSCQQGDSFNWQGLSFEMVAGQIGFAQENDDSCVIELSDGVHKVLLAGDISSHIENKLVAEQRLSEVDVLLAPHHGSGSSSSYAFLKTVSPKYSIFSNGYLNQWGMPNADVLNRYQQLDIQAITTAENGMVQATFRKKTMEIATYRKDLMPYWFINL